MKKILIFGNSGSGKSTLAKFLAEREDIPHLDLDVLAWLPVSPPQRQPLEQSAADIREFLAGHEQWVVEGCYTDLLEVLAAEATEAIFMDLPVEQCVANARNRPWEPHKYESKEAQDANLEMLVDWIRDYANRTDTFSYTSHRDFYERFPGKKVRHRENPDCS